MASCDDPFTYVGLPAIWPEFWIAPLSVEEYHHELLLNNRHARSYNNLGVINMKREELNRAVSYFQNSLKIDPNYQESVVYLNKLIGKEQ